MATTTPIAPPSSGRLTSLDQFRGYTMLGMLLVNFVGSYTVIPRILEAYFNDYCSYADTIMPHFLFAAGFAMRLSLGRRRDASGKMPWGRAIRRILGLAVVAIVWYSRFCDLDGIIKHFRTKPIGEVLVILFKREYFQTLLHIAVTSLWILPVVTLSSRVRFTYAIASGLLHVFLSWWFNFVWVNSDPTAIDGGPLGFLTWSIPALFGTLACDAVRSRQAPRRRPGSLSAASRNDSRLGNFIRHSAVRCPDRIQSPNGQSRTKRRRGTADRRWPGCKPKKQRIWRAIQ